MGIRFRCHHCEHELHVKDFQGGRRGRCPECQGVFRIPQEDAELSIAVDAAQIGKDQATKTHASPTQASPMQASKTQAGKMQASKMQASPTHLGKQPAQNIPAEEGAIKSQTKLPTPTSPDSQTFHSQAEEASPAIQPLEAPASLQTGLPKALTDAPGATWYARPTTGGQFGPAACETFIQWLVEGRISRDALVWRDGWPEWLSGAQAFPDYFGPEATREGLPSDVVAVAKAISGAPAPPASPGSAAPAATASLGDRNRLGRKQQKRRRYIMLLSILSVMFVCLIVALLVVLMQSEVAK